MEEEEGATITDEPEDVKLTVAFARFIQTHQSEQSIILAPSEPWRLEEGLALRFTTPQKVVKGNSESLYTSSSRPLRCLEDGSCWACTIKVDEGTCDSPREGENDKVDLPGEVGMRHGSSP